MCFGQSNQMQLTAATIWVMPLRLLHSSSDAIAAAAQQQQQQQFFHNHNQQVLEKFKSWNVFTGTFTKAYKPHPLLSPKTSGMGYPQRWGCGFESCKKAKNL
jgi:hypothetical protein